MIFIFLKKRRQQNNENNDHDHSKNDEYYAAPAWASAGIVGSAADDFIVIRTIVGLEMRKSMIFFLSRRQITLPMPLEPHRHRPVVSLSFLLWTTRPAVRFVRQARLLVPSLHARCIEGVGYRVRCCALKASTTLSLLAARSYSRN